ncbi:hypothetical protein GPY51_19420 [Photorhabdus laumondii subsp. laumondii]|uniref:DUF5347 family protein n=2 Tax=Photorhabdus TaxID=29487 RepID=A0AAW6BL40_9GAMM|nr:MULTISPECIES: DUF5347 family protein [Photorhabdus]AXG42650.1 hypothetical protein PluDJC_10605 [Photorhabdus laumondii subsp. laumondii]MCC8384759.1 DUF5347 family protein [Photorhabdus laumondii]MCC8413496.1 DUF5347 family protein [Photorhabdus laumondii]MDB6372297.1 DUF5347 family protein [Photorhabdus bodei]NDK96458.1 hypothetical protein [Photorhabdus laumondii subsp. laumondii]
MANTEAFRFAKIAMGNRADALNQLSAIRYQHFGNNEKELSEFVSLMRDRWEWPDSFVFNKRVLIAIFNLADIPESRHDISFNEFTSDERKSLVRTINHLKVVASIFPERLSIPR